MLVRPRDSRCLWTALQIQLILGSLRICIIKQLDNCYSTIHSGTYSLVAWVDEDDLVVLVDTVLVDPVRVQDTKVAAPLADTLLRHALKTTLGLEVVDTLTDGLAVGGT